MARLDSANPVRTLLGHPRGIRRTSPRVLTGSSPGAGALDISGIAADFALELLGRHGAPCASSPLFLSTRDILGPRAFLEPLATVEFCLGWPVIAHAALRSKTLRCEELPEVAAAASAARQATSVPCYASRARPAAAVVADRMSTIPSVRRKGTRANAVSRWSRNVSRWPRYLDRLARPCRP